MSYTTGGASGETKDVIDYIRFQRQEKLRAVCGSEGGLRRPPVKPAISLKGISKKYRISPTRSSRLGEILTLGKANKSHEFWALQDVDLQIDPGITLGVVGRNGAGKSTLLSIISGVLRPTSGEVLVRGRLSAIFGLGAGFNPLFTGRENAMLSGLILGIEYEEMLERFDEIEAFADIGEFMDQPIKTYSSGMRGRLGFAVAVNVEPDVLVIDEALSAGDSAFKKKAIRRMYELRDSGSTVLFVSHSMGMVKRFCTQAVLLHKGRLLSVGDPEEVVEHYEGLLADSKEMKEATSKELVDSELLESELDYEIDHEEEEDTPPAEHHTPSAGATSIAGGSSSVDSSVEESSPKKRSPKNTPRVALAGGGQQILKLEVLDEQGQPCEKLPSGGTLTLRVKLPYEQFMEQGTLSIGVHTHSEGVELFRTQTTLGGAPQEGGEQEQEEGRVEYTFAIGLAAGEYEVQAWLLGGRRAQGLEEEQGATKEEVAKTRASIKIGEQEEEGTEGSSRGVVRVAVEVEIRSVESRHQGPA
jgi:ABC-type polysaccharide/polyol phosphate transport system ATPase subunit